MANNTDPSDMLPFGRTAVTPRELESLLEIQTATELLAANGCEKPARDIDRYLEALPALLQWLANNGREFPWRETTDPWRVYVSEILLQRTRAEAVAGIYDEFFSRFPGPPEIRRADEEEILETVKSLGFVNHRIRTLNDVARILGQDHSDSVPDSLAELQRPWRVGPYSARATMMFAFGEPYALVDTNFARVTERVFGIDMPEQPHKSEEIYSLLDALLPSDPGVARGVNLAILDLANEICTPTSPDCPSCPLQESCTFAARHTPNG